MGLRCAFRSELPPTQRDRLSDPPGHALWTRHRLEEAAAERGRARSAPPGWDYAAPSDRNCPRHREIDLATHPATPSGRGIASRKQLLKEDALEALHRDGTTLRLQIGTAPDTERST